jgi:hypothetical protein
MKTISFVTQTLASQDYHNTYEFHVPQEYQEIVTNLYRRCFEKNNNYMRISLSYPYKKRTTGEKSQNNAIWGYATQIAIAAYDDPDEIVKEAKRRAAKRGYPYKRDEDDNIIISKITGKPKMESMKVINTVEAGYIIEELKDMAAFLNIRLVENDTERREL